MGREESRQEEYRQLLQSLKGTAEGLLISQVSNVWNVYGGLNRLHHVMENIFKHGCRVFNQDGDPDCWIFIQGLSWLKPSLAVSPTFLVEVEDENPQLPPNVREKALAWLYRSLEGHTLSQKLSWLLSDREHLLSCFEKFAYLCQEKYGEATLICLRAVEQNQPYLLTEIDPCLYLSAWNYKTFQKTHRRCSSFPETQYSAWHASKIRAVHFEKQSSEDIQVIAAETGSQMSINTQSCSGKDQQDSSGSNPCKETTECTTECSTVEGKCKNRVKRWLSLPTVFNVFDNQVDDIRERSETVSCYRSGSKTLPSSPNKLFPRSSSAILKHRASMSMSEACSKLSASILEIDYTSEQQCVADHKDWKDVPCSKMEILNECPRSVLTSSGSSDTLSVDVSKPNGKHLPKLSHPSAREMPLSINSNIRPSELKLPVRFWPESDDPSAQIQCTQAVQWDKQDIIAPEYAVDGTGAGRRPFKKSFIEDGGSSVLPMATGFFPRPVEGQSLTSFLSSGQFARPSAELDRENAHFSISEAMIAVIEQVKCNRQLRVAEERGEVGDESDEEFNHLKQRIRLRRRQRQEEKQNHVWASSLLSDGKTDTTTTDQSVSPLSSSPGTPSDSISTDDVDDLEVDEVKNLAQLKYSGLSVSMASLYSEADLSKHPVPRTGTDLALTESIVSAEGVALSLLRQFSDKQLPRASDLQWLVSEQEAPQQLLPMPTSWPISPDEAEDADMRQATPLRGTMEWAPPRPQVIFTSHAAPTRRVLMAKQNYRCAGCGMKVAVKYCNRFRYCEYLGRYFCTGCHTNQVALIPGKVLTKWDFTRYPVSSFSYRLLDQMMSDRLFVIGDVNSSLYRKARQLDQTKQLRLQLIYLKEFIFTCRFAAELQERLRQEVNYLWKDVDGYSMQDLLQVKSGELPSRIRELVSCCCRHVADCELCTARGFVCELCTSKEVIFPWYVNKVTRCSSCGTCFHSSCWTSSPCPRCIRLQARRASQSDADVADIQVH